MWIKRPSLIKTIQKSLAQSPVTALMGPRQCGKTTLAKQIAQNKKWSYFDLESPVDQARLLNAQRVLSSLEGMVILDEIQRLPSLFNVLRGISDRKPLQARFLILGSASPELVRGASETLAGRVRFVDIGGFSLSEVGDNKLNSLWLKGGFPRSFLAKNLSESNLWRENFIRTYLERDIPQLGLRIPAITLHRFWTMLAHTHGQIWNSSNLAASLGVAHTTTRHYLDILSGVFLVRQLPPWFENVGKRIVKSPKVYIRDSGLLHSLLRIPDQRTMESHPKYGSSWEGFAIEELLNVVGNRDSYFWATHAGAELDLLLIRLGKRWGFEFKTQEAPAMTKSMHIALKDLKLEHLWVIHPGKEHYPLFERVDCIPLAQALKLPLWK